LDKLFKRLGNALSGFSRLDAYGWRTTMVSTGVDMQIPLFSALLASAERRGISATASLSF